MHLGFAYSCVTNVNAHKDCEQVYIESMHLCDAGIHPSVFMHPCFAGMHKYQACMQNVRASILFKNPRKLITNSREHELVGGPPFLWMHANFAWAMAR